MFFIIPPKESIYVETDHFKLLECNIRKYSAQGKVAIIGDLNARCSSENDFSVNDYDLDRYLHNFWIYIYLYRMVLLRLNL